MEIVVKGLIVKELGHRGLYVFYTGKERMIVYSSSPLRIGPMSLTLLSDEKGYRVVSSQSIDQSELSLNHDDVVDERQPLISDDIMIQLTPQIRETAKRIKRAVSMGRDILLRFHNDADGIAGGLAIYRVLKSMDEHVHVSNRQNSSVIYNPSDALADLNTLTSYNPLVLIIDFGSGEESQEAINLLRAAGVEVVMIDHHPYDVQPTVDYYLSPWILRSDKRIDLSQYTAGYLSVEVARLLGLDDDTAKRLTSISFSGDKSRFRKIFSDDETALVFDYLGTYSTFPNTLDFYNSLLDNQSLRESIYHQAKDKLDTIRDKGFVYLKVKDVPLSGMGDGLLFGTINIEKVIKKFEFPSKAKTIGVLFDTLVERNPGRPVIVVGYGGKLITFRVNDEGFQIGLSARDLVKEILTEFKDLVVGGGGHDKAASVRTMGNEYTKIIMEWLENKIMNRSWSSQDTS